MKTAARPKTANVFAGGGDPIAQRQVNKAEVDENCRGECQAEVAGVLPYGQKSIPE